MGDPKYIVTKSGSVVIFSSEIVHSHFRNLEIKTAGFVSIGVKSYGVGVTCYGRSESLDIDSDPKDAYIVMRHILKYNLFEIEEIKRRSDTGILSKLRKFISGLGDRGEPCAKESFERVQTL